MRSRTDGTHHLSTTSPKKAAAGADHFYAPSKKAASNTDHFYAPFVQCFLGNSCPSQSMRPGAHTSTRPGYVRRTALLLLQQIMMARTASDTQSVPMHVFVELAAGTSPAQLNAACGNDSEDGSVRPFRLFCSDCREFITNFVAWNPFLSRKSLPRVLDYANQSASSKVRRHREDRHGPPATGVASYSVTAASTSRKRKAAESVTISEVPHIAESTPHLAAAPRYYQRAVVARTDAREYVSIQVQHEQQQQQQGHAPRTTLALSLQQQPRLEAGVGHAATAVVRGQPSVSDPAVMLAQRYTPGMPITLPCLLQLNTVDPQYGPQQVWAVLYHAGETAASHQPLPADVHRKPHLADAMIEPFRLVDAKLGTEARCLYLHKIVHVSPMMSPFSIYVNRWFSSFGASARLFGKASGAAMGWKVLNNTQSSLPLAQVISECGFRNPDIRRVVRTASQPANELGTDGKYVASLELISSLVSYKDDTLLSLAPKSTSDPDHEDEAYDGDAQTDATSQPPRRPPGWVSSKDRDCFLRRAKNGAALRDATFADCLSALCETECNDLECAMPDCESTPEEESLILTNGWTCSHGVRHTPYHDEELVRNDDGTTTAADPLFRRPKKRLGVMEETTVDTNGNLIVKRKKCSAVDRSQAAWERCIQFDTLQTSQQVKATRLVAPKLVGLVCRLLDMQRGPEFRQAINMITTSVRRLVEPETLSVFQEFPNFEHMWTSRRDCQVVRGGDGSTYFRMELCLNVPIARSIGVPDSVIPTVLVDVGQNIAKQVKQTYPQLLRGIGFR